MNPSRLIMFAICFVCGLIVGTLIASAPDEPSRRDKTLRCEPGEELVVRDGGATCVDFYTGP